MNKYFTYVLSLLFSAVSLVAVAQESNYPDSLNGYFRLSNLLHLSYRLHPGRTRLHHSQPRQCIAGGEAHHLKDV